MGNTLQGNQVLLFGAQRDIAPHPVVQLGVDANGLARPVVVGADGSLLPITDGLLGALTESAPANDTAGSGLNGRLQRIAQRLTSLLGLAPAALTGAGNLKVAVQEALPAGTNNLGKVGSAQSSAAPTNTAGTPFTVLTADGNVFTLAAGETGFIQNHDDAVLNFKLGTGCSTTSLSGRLKACSAADDGGGGFIKIANWTGVVSVAAATGSPRFTAWKI